MHVACLGRFAALFYIRLMDRLIAIDEDHEAGATSPPLSLAVIKAIGELLAVAAQFVAAKAALRRGDLETLRRTMPLAALALMFSIRLTVRWGELVRRVVGANVARARRKLHYPPQTWAAP